MGAALDFGDCHGINTSWDSKRRDFCSRAHTVITTRPPIRNILASSRIALTRRSVVAKWCTTASDNTASKLSSRNGKSKLSQIATCWGQKDSRYCLNCCQVPIFEVIRPKILHLLDSTNDSQSSNCAATAFRFPAVTEVILDLITMQLLLHSNLFKFVSAVFHRHPQFSLAEGCWKNSISSFRKSFPSYRRSLA